MNVLQLISSGGYYGAENVILNLSKFLADLGCKVLLGVFNNVQNPHLEIARQAEREGVAVELIRCRGRIDWKAISAIRTCIRVHHIDVLHTHAYKANIYGYAAARNLPVSRVSTCHNWTSRSHALRLYERLDRRILKHIDAVVAVSDPLASVLHAIGVPQERIATINNGIEVERFAPGAAEPWKPFGNGRKLTVGTVGRLSKEKGSEFFLRAAQGVLAEFPDAVFIFVGEGPERERLEGLACHLGIQPNVIFTGRRDDMPGVYLALDVVVLPSVNEGMPMAILEAMAARRPVIATAVGAVPKLIAHQRTGLLVGPGDVPALREAIALLLRDTRLREELGQRGYDRVRENFSARTMAQNYLRVYETQVSGKRANSYQGEAVKTAALCP